MEFLSSSNSDVCQENNQAHTGGHQFILSRIWAQLYTKYIMQTQTKGIKSLKLVIKIKLTINVPFHSTARSLPPLAGHGHRKPLKCGQPLASTLQEMTVQQATQMHPADTSGPCGFHEQTNCKTNKKGLQQS